MDWYFIVLIVVGFLLISELIVAFFAFKALFGRKPGEGSFKDLDLSNTLYKNHEKRIKEEFIFLENLISENVYITSHDGLKLRGFYIDNHSDKTVFFVHGYRATPLNNFSWVARKMYDEGYNLFFIDQRAHGESEGKYTTFGIKERFDVVSWSHFINEKYNPKHIILYGLSMGCASSEMALELDLPDNVRCAILDCGFKSVFSLMVYQTKKRIKFGATISVLFMNIYCKLLGGFSMFDASSEKALKNAKIPCFFIHGTNDMTVPLSHGKANYNACNSSKDFMFLHGVEHALCYYEGYPDLENKIISFIDKSIE